VARGSRGLGDAGEKLALNRLLELGYELLEANWRRRAGELDLVMREGETVVFVEVRTRRGEGLGTPEESVTRAKQQRLVSLATLWLAETYPDERDLPEWRIDVVGVHLSASGRLLEINHLPGAVGFG
jgi:putative endonuclease